jgi:uncharacterized protein YciW
VDHEETLRGEYGDRVPYVLIDGPAAVTDEDITVLRNVGLGDTGIVQLTHLVSDFVAWNRANDALNTDYEYDPRWLDAASLTESRSG